MKDDFSLPQAGARYEKLLRQLAKTGWISEDYAQNRRPGTGGLCYQWTPKARKRTMSGVDPGDRICN